MGSPLWTANEAKIVAENWFAGKPASEIGRMLNRTRNSVMGFIHRMKQKDEAVKRPPRAPKPEKVRTPRAPRPRMPSIRGVNFVDTKYQNEPEGSVSFMDLTRYQCHWVKEAKGGIDTLYCGHPVVDGTSWCPFHWNITFIKRTDRERLADPKSFGKVQAGAGFRFRQK